MQLFCFQICFHFFCFHFFCFQFCFHFFCFRLFCFQICFRFFFSIFLFLFIKSKMNKIHIKVFFFGLSLYMCASDKVFANEPSLVNFTPPKDAPTKDVLTKGILTKGILNPDTAKKPPHGEGNLTKTTPPDNPFQTDDMSPNNPFNTDDLSADNPFHEDDISAGDIEPDNPFHEDDISADNPFHTDDLSLDDLSLDNPFHTDAISPDNPFHTDAISPDNPFQTDNISAGDIEPDNPFQTNDLSSGDIASDNPFHTDDLSLDDLSSDNPFQTDDMLPNNSIHTDDTSSDNSFQTYKKKKKSILVRLVQRMSAILIVILRAFACKQSKPKKYDLNKHIRTKNVPENATLGKATPDKSTTDKSTTDKSTTDKSTTDKSTTDSVNLDNDVKNDIMSINDSFDEIYEHNKNLVCNDSEETEKVTKFMNEAVTLLHKQIETTDGYQNHFNYNNSGIYTKKQDDKDIGKLNITIENPDKYDDIKNMLWDPNNPQNIDHRFLNGKPIRVYNPNLMIIQQCYMSISHSSIKYFHYLAKRVEISKDKTLIVYISTNMSDVNNDVESNISTLLEIAYSLESGCNFEEELKKKFVNLSGYSIKKKDTHIDVTYFNSIIDNYILAPLYDFKRVRSKNYILLMNLKEIFSPQNKYIPNSTFLLS
ncbi:fam-a protein [Plasmodium yoelii]|nr:fam-a protein [Plasmodium yoelii]CDU17761.1 fam-a protein [Plasmodium yoelii]VTZ77802.1 fam-a protein [Plasmodium yoelii]|eukprot:XP_022812069.1 fam-a protein [Plasmodium yoelii]